MLTIRWEQQEAFSQAALRRFEDEMLIHLHHFAPKHCEVVGDQAVQDVIRLGRERAQAHGFTNKGPVRFYLELMMMFGGYFDTDPHLPWARAVLSDSKTGDQMIRAGQLYAAFQDYSSRALGPGYKFEFEALRRLSKMRLEDVPAAIDQPEEFGVAALAALYPEKARYLGDVAVRDGVRVAVKLAASYSATSPRAVAPFVVLAFIAGHRFDNDPLFPWIRATLQDERFPDPNDRARRLYTRATTYLRQMVSYFEKET